MSASTAFYWISIAYLVVLLGSAIAAVRLWLLNDAYEMGAANRPARRTTNMAVLSLAMIGAFASVVLFFLSQAINGESDARVAEANGAAKEAQKQTTAMALEIARIKAPRSLSDDQTGAIKEACARFPGTKFDMAVTQGDPEAEDFELRIENLLKSSGWQQMPWKSYGFARSRKGGQQIGEYTAQNVLVIIHKDWIDRLMPAANALAESLQNAGIVVDRASDVWSNEGESANPLMIDSIHIVVGRKSP